MEGTMFTSKYLELLLAIELSVIGVLWAVLIVGLYHIVRDKIVRDKIREARRAQIKPPQEAHPAIGLH